MPSQSPVFIRITKSSVLKARCNNLKSLLSTKDNSLKAKPAREDVRRGKDITKLRCIYMTYLKIKVRQQRRGLLGDNNWLGQGTNCYLLESTELADFRRAEPRWLRTRQLDNSTLSGSYARHWVVCYTKECQAEASPYPVPPGERHKCVLRGVCPHVFLWGRLRLLTDCPQHTIRQLFSSSGGHRAGRIVRATLCPQPPLFWQGSWQWPI